MKSDVLIKSEGMQALFEKLGIVGAEKFISLIKQESFDYTEWQKELWKDLTATELFDLAEKRYKQKKLS